MNSYLPPPPFPVHESHLSTRYSSKDDVMATSHSSLPEAWVEFRERQILEQYYEMSRILKDVRGGNFLVKSATTSPVQKIKVKTL
jgi:hypothetical protein